MIKKVVRMKGNEEYDYAKSYIVLTGDKLYVSTTVCNDFGVLKVLVELDKNYIRTVRSKGVEEVAQLLDLIRPRFAGADHDEDWNRLLNVNSKVKKAMQVCEITGEIQENVGGIKGLTISNV